jgi:hypothetical protein
MQNNSGGVNIQQGTTGQNSPIVDSPITVGEVLKRITPADMTTITGLLSSAPHKARVKIVVDQNSNAREYATDLYKAVKDSGWMMEDTGVVKGIVLAQPGSMFHGMEFKEKGEPIKPNESINVPSSDPLFYLGGVAEILKVQRSLNRNTTEPDGLITVTFVGGLPE